MGLDLDYTDYQNSGVRRTVSPQAPLPVALVAPLANWTAFPTGGYDTDGAGVSSARLRIIAEEAVFNDGTGNAERWRNNVAGTLLAAAARTATAASPDQTNYNGTKLQIVLNVTAASGSGGLTVTVQGKDPVSGTYYALNANPTAVTATGIYVYEIALGVGAASGGVTQRTGGMIPRTWRANVAVGDASSYTYSLGFSLDV